MLGRSNLLSEEERKKITQGNNTFPSDYIQTRIKHLLDQSLIESTVTNEFRNLSEMTHNLRILKSSFFSLISAIIDYNVAGIFFNNLDNKSQKILSISSYNLEINENTLKDIEYDFFSKIFKEEYKNNYETFSTETLNKVSLDEQVSVNDISEFKSQFVFPIIFANKVLGGLCLYSRSPNRFRQSKILNIILNELKVLMRLRWLYSETKHLAITDGLTGLYNRRHFQKILENEFARAARYKLDLGLALIDIDHFKKINDTYGHQFGDKVLAEVSFLAQKALRRTDYVARYGGEEIVVILTETTKENLYVPIERIKNYIENNEFLYHEKYVKVTVSIGVAMLSSEMSTQEELILKADNALYSAKREGRNRVKYDLSYT